jgi:hypothetical protein
MKTIHEVSHSREMTREEVEVVVESKEMKMAMRLTKKSR